MVLVIMTIQVLVALRVVSGHFTRPFEERLIFYFLQNLLHRLSEYGINRLHVGLSSLSRKIPPRLVTVILFRPVITPFGGDDLLLSFPFPCSWSSSTLLYLSILSISWRTLVTSLPVRDFLKPCLVGRPLLNVLMATLSWFSSISLYTSQYLSEYAFKVSPSCIDKDNNELRVVGLCYL